MASEPPWTSATELAEYAYCPRAHFYRRQGEAPPSPAATEGESFHHRRLASERWREEHAPLAWAVVGAGVVLLAVAVGALLR